jgi:Domain of unknown function (DUF4440)
MKDETLSHFRLFGVGCLAGFALCFAASAAAQTSRWAGNDDPAAKQMIALEHQWTQDDCVRNGIVATLLAEDFEGTSPDGKRYSKQQALATEKDTKYMARACQTYSVKVHFFGDNMALLYGGESAIWKSPGGSAPRKLVWTDTWLKRNGKWQIVAAQDMAVPMK